MPEQDTKSVLTATPQKKSSSKTIITIIIVILGLCALCSLAGGILIYLRIKNIYDSPDFIDTSFLDTISEISDEASDIASELENQDGTITGALGYPSEYIPAQEVCAQDTTSGEKQCVDTEVNQQSYTLTVPAGTYNVYAAIANDTMSGYKAYYSQAVICGLSVDCNDHTPIDVTVEAGSTQTDIDVIDWYDFSQ